MKNKRQPISTTVQLSSERFLLNIFVKPDLSYGDGNGFISLTDKEESFIGDNLSYFFDMDLEKKEEMKKILKDNGFETKGYVKELKALLKRANKLGIIKIKE